MLQSLRLNFRLLAIPFALICLDFPICAQTGSQTNKAVPKPILLQILKAEDERRWDKDLEQLLTNSNPAIRTRTLLAAGRIGDERAIPTVAELLEKETDPAIQAMAAFALGEIESPAATEALISHADDRKHPAVKARAVEALGKIAAVMPKTEEARANAAKQAILRVLEFEAERRSGPDEDVILLGITAALRARPEGAGKVITEFLTYGNPRIRADAANALARLRAKDGNDLLRKLLTSDTDPVVRANAARVLGATEDKDYLKALLDRATADRDIRVRVSAIRALASLKDPIASEQLMKHVAGASKSQAGLSTGELLEIVTVVGRLQQATGNKDTFSWLKELRSSFAGSAPELEIALVRVSPEQYLQALAATSDAKRKAQETILTDWRSASALAQGLGEIAALPDSTKDKPSLAKQAEDVLRAMLDYRNSGLNINTLVVVHSEYAIPDVLRAYAAFKPGELATVLRNHLKETDAVVRGTAAELLGELPANDENANALIAAMPVALNDKQLNDAALAIVDALTKQKTTAANEALKTALKSSDHLIRRRAAAGLKANGAGDFSAQVDEVHTRNSLTDYERALARDGKQVLATIKTDRGNFVIELLPVEAPLTVDNFVELARRGYFNRVTFHRVVPNFVIQGGDPRGDGNGGPGYSIRCEINTVPYNRGALGMALSGKDTGGSQWFVTHSPQPHLDGGYTVFGRVIEGMNVVDLISRGDAILSISITERPLSRQRARATN